MARLTAFFPAESVFQRPRKGTRTAGPEPWYALSAQHRMPPVVRASSRPWERAALMSWTAPGRAGEAQMSFLKGSLRPAEQRRELFQSGH